MDNQATLNACKYMADLVGAPVCFLDFEFNQSAEPVLNLVSVSCLTYDPASHKITPVDMWLYHDPERYRDLKEYLDSLRDNGTILVAYGVAAEARSLMALGIDPHAHHWVDLYAEWRQLTFNNNSCEYGIYFSDNGFKRTSVPPSFDASKNRGKDNNKVGMGYVDCVGQLFGVWIDSMHKKEMRDLIIANLPEYSPEQQKAIMDYGRSDVVYLPFIWQDLTRRLQLMTKLELSKILSIQQTRGKYMVSIAKMETNGIPLNIEKVRNLRKNFEYAQNEILEDLVTNYYPFYYKEKKNKKDWAGTWTEKYSSFEYFIEQKGLLKKWPRTVDSKTKKPSNKKYVTASGKKYYGTLSRKEGDLEKFDGIKEIHAYRQAKKAIKQMAWFRAPSESKRKKDGDFFDNVGSDNRLRTFMGAFGTQTSRNAPAAKRFILAMSKWLRCLIEPPKGRVLIAADYSSQEFGIAAVKSRDSNMIKAYQSGDPYLFFAKEAKAVPQEADPKLCKSPYLVISELTKKKWPDKTFHHGLNQTRLGQLAMDYPQEVEFYLKFVEYKRQRGLFKSTTLGLQFGMGYVNLAVKLSSDMGEVITEGQSKKLVELHRKVYPDYWEEQERVIKNYRKFGCIVLWDGWALGPDNENDLSVKNMPVQGTGGVILREAVRLGHLEGLDIMATLHDAGYFEEEEDKAEETAEKIVRILKQAFTNVLGDTLDIRIDVDIHRHGEVWVEEGGEKFYKMLGKYLEPMVTKDDRKQQLISTIYKISP